ncbi:MAG: hypothetical protein ACK5HU_03295 [Flavobacteriales bacterium]
MKTFKTPLILFALCLTSWVYGQQIVSDPKNTAINIAIQGLQETSNQTAGDQLNIVKKSLELSEKWEKALTRVSDIVRSGKRVTEVVKAQKDIIKEYKKGLEKLESIRLKTLSLEEVQLVVKMHEKLVAKTVEQVEELYSVIKEGLRMNDAERLTFIDKVIATLVKIKKTVTLLNEKVAQIDKKRTLEAKNKAFFSRKTEKG